MNDSSRRNCSATISGNPDRSSSNDIKILILIPAYNAGRYLKELVDRVRKAVEKADILIINDGSTDETSTILPSLNALNLTNSANMGKGFALNRGFDFAVRNSYNYIITIDADLQHLPEELPRFTNFSEQADIFMGTRRMSLSHMPFLRWVTNNLTSLIISIFSGTRIRDTQSGYRMITVDTLRRLRVKSRRYDFESEMLFQAGALGVRIAEVPISTVYEGSHSYINPLVDSGRFIKLIWRRIWL
jgi:glycosyltransferase involved in cell wall biosynthesis